MRGGTNNGWVIVPPKDGAISLYHYAWTWRWGRLTICTVRWCRFMEPRPSTTNFQNCLSYYAGSFGHNFLNCFIFWFLTIFFRAISPVRNGSTVITLNCMKFRFRFKVYLKLLQNSQPLFKSPDIDKVVRIPKNSDIQNFQKLICDHDLLGAVIKPPQ